VLIVGWGSTYGAITAAVRELHARGESVASIHLRHLNPLPADLGAILAGYEMILVPELNLGQLLMLLRARYLVGAIGLNKVKGQPFKVSEIRSKVQELLSGGNGGRGGPRPSQETAATRPAAREGAS
jgi:2-oxoglutarate ferredoxin oxidoreductase subunit alpha